MGPTGVEVGAEGRAVAADSGPSELGVDSQGYSDAEVGVSEQAVLGDCGMERHRYTTVTVFH